MSSMRVCRVFALLLLSGALTAQAHAFRITVEDQDGNPVDGFRYIVQEDTTHWVVPGVQTMDILSLGIHHTHAPVVASGHGRRGRANVRADQGKRYYVSVLPDGGHTMSGAQVAPRQGSVTVVVNRLPVPTAQISVYVFHDNKPLNNAPDIPAEAGLEGFSITMHDQLGQQMMDAFGNMIGTTYQQNPDGTFMYDDEGNPIVEMMGNGYLLSDANGEALIKNLPPGKYAVIVTPPAGEDWVQTTTIEGKPPIDAWIRPGEPRFLGEFGAFFWHTFYGFVQPSEIAPSAEGTGTIQGQVYYLHENRPPQDRGGNSGRTIDGVWIGLNNLAGNDEVLYAAPAEADGSFSIENVPPGTYQVVVWDVNLDVIIGFRTAVVPPEGGTVDLGNVAVWAWFGFLEGTVFLDENGNGMPDEGEAGLRDQAVNLRFADGSMYATTPTDPMGEYEFGEVFPWFRWIVAEVDFLRFKATGLKIVVDDGGATAPGEPLVPQAQPDNGGLGWRVDTDSLLTQAMMLFAGQTNQIYWGKQPYAEGENGGISGIVFYATTRAENEPQQAAAENWEVGIPRVQMCLYMDADADGKIDDLDGDGERSLADVDNYPFGWRGGTRRDRGPEDVDRNRNGTFDTGDAINIATTDSWDDNQPDAVGEPQYVRGQLIPSGAETLQTWNQVRPGVFDGGYAFESYFPGGMFSGSDEVDGLPPGYYIVEACTPPGHEIVKEEDKNVDFGDSYYPAGGPDTPGIITAAQGIVPTPYDPPLPVGDDHLVPAELTLFPGIEAPYAGQKRPLADRKQVLLADQENAAADFFCFTPVPIAGRIWGWVLNDLLYTLDPNSPNYRINFGPSWLPVSVRDMNGHEVCRVYTDEFGKYSALVPSTYTVSIPNPTGVSPGMWSLVINDPGPIPDPDNRGRMITDPYYNEGYGTVSYTLDFWPGKTTFCDTPVVPIGAFQANSSGLDCEFPDGTPVIASVSARRGGGPYIPYPGRPAERTIVIESVGQKEISNPNYDPDDPNSPVTITRDLGFGGTRGTVTVDGVPLQVVRWDRRGRSIMARVPTNITTGQLTVTRGDNGMSSVLGVTLHVAQAGDTYDVIRVGRGMTIQDAIDAAAPGDLILVPPGTYRENLIVWKPVQLQGYGAYSTTILGGNMNPDEDAVWQAKFQQLVDAGAILDIPSPFFFEEFGVGVTVSGDGTVPEITPMIDGVTVTGSGRTEGGPFAGRGAGIFFRAYTNNWVVSNNSITRNQGSWGGGIRVGTPSLINEAGDGYVSSENNNLVFRNNHITQNGAALGGGGIALFNGSNNYQVTENGICGNFTVVYGGGIAHFGKSDGGMICDNVILNNQAFDEGAGIMIAGELVPAGAPAGTLSEGAGDVTIDGNLIQGNLANDDGGGIRMLLVNGQDVVDDPDTPANWHTVRIINNILANNSSSDAGAGISMDDAASVFIVNNTIAHNDTTSTGVDAFGPNANENAPLPNSTHQVAGISSNVHSLDLQGAFGAGLEQTFSDPVLEDNILWENRSFYWDAATEALADPINWDLGVYNTVGPAQMSPMNCILSDLTVMYGDGTTGGEYDAGNLAADPLLIAPYLNEYSLAVSENAFGALVITTFTPLGQVGDYHTGAGSPAINLGAGNYLGAIPGLAVDYDDQARPAGGVADAGADEVE
jgi:hypothetical protein